MNNLNDIFYYLNIDPTEKAWNQIQNQVNLRIETEVLNNIRIQLYQFNYQIKTHIINQVADQLER
jgi:hypothetical protein